MQLFKIVSGKGMGLPASIGLALQISTSGCLVSQQECLSGNIQSGLALL